MKYTQGTARRRAAARHCGCRYNHAIHTARTREERRMRRELLAGGLGFGALALLAPTVLVRLLELLASTL